MAYNYQSFATLGVNLNRQNYGSLDISQVFNSQADLNYYMSKGAIKDGVSKYWLDTVPYPYAGQYLALVEDGKVSAYILSEKTDGTFEALEVGKVPVGDNKSIEVAEDGTVSIKGFNEITAAQDEFLPRIKWNAEVPAQGEEGQEGYIPAVPAYAEIEWVPVAEVVEGDGNTISKVTSVDGSVTVTESKDTSTDTITYDVSVKVPEYRILKDGRVEGSKEQTYHLTKDGEAFGVAITVPDAYDGTETENRVSDLEDKIGYKAEQTFVEEGLALKANAADVYTKTETDTEIGKAIAAADHLKRVIVRAPEENETLEDVIDVTKDDADQYIYMVPTGLQENDNKYREYIVIFERNTEGTITNKYIEQVGNWEVDLTDYLTKAAAEETYAKKNDVAETIKDYVTDDELSTTLEDYALKSEIPTDYVSDEEIKAYDTAEIAEGKYAPKEATTQALNDRYTKTEIDTLLDDYYTVEETNSLLDDKVTVETGKSLIADTEIERLAKVNENAEENFINSVDETVFTVTAEKLGLKAVPQKVIGDLTQTSWTVETTVGEGGKEINNFVATTAPAFLADILKPATYDPVNKTGTSGLMTAEQVQKLQALVISDEGVEISGTVNADNVTGLGAWITTNRDKVEGLYPVAAKNLLDDLDDAINNEKTGLIAGLGAVEARVLVNETAIDDHTDRIEALEYAMTWHEIENNENA